MSDKPRRWFQIHLSTAIMLVFVAGLFVHFNLKLRWAKGGNSSEWYLRKGESIFSMVRGWPFPVIKYWEIPEGGDHSSFSWAGGNSVFDRVKVPVSKITDGDPDDIKYTTEDPPEWYLLNLALDVVIGVATLTLAWILLERLNRRREARKP
jgi:hypothetical protein